jgi:FAD/FMN-containing dehydrogenase
MTTFLDPGRAESLRGLCGGHLHLPGDAGYDGSRTPWNVAVRQQPAAVAVPRDAADVSALVRAAAAAGLRVAPQSSGHNAGPLAAQGLDDVVIVRTSALTDVSVDPARGIVRVGGGTLWEPAVDAAAELGRAVLHGSSPDVAIAGYSLGGGMGWYARKLGLATNSLTAVELVIADGTRVRADATTNPELFWAVRGGGGNFGVVTALEFRMYPIETAYAGFLAWDQSHTEKVLRTWSAWAPDAPDEITTSFRVMNFPDMPELPGAVRGRSLVMIDGAVLDGDARAEEILADLRSLSPEIDTFGRVPAKSLVRLHLDPEGATPVVSDSAMLADLPEVAIEAFLDAVGPDSGTTLLMAELRQLGGALGRPHEGGGALSQLEGSFAAFGAGIAATPEMAAQGHADAVRFTSALAPFTTGSSYLNFAENETDARTAYTADRWTQLKGIKSAVDPKGLIVANHRIPRLWENGRATD